MNSTQYSPSDQQNAHFSADSGGPVCRVCEKTYDGAQHCGVEVCRACAAFYRRAAATKKHFVCRRGTNTCRLDTGRKECCQKCRYVKCLEAGLTLTGKADSSDDMDTTPASKRSESSEDREVSIPSTSSPDLPITPVSLVEIPLLPGIFEKYQYLCSQRLEYELEIGKSFPGVRTIECSGKRLSMLNLRTVSAVYRYQEPLIQNMVVDIFPIFGEFPIEHQMKVFQQYVPMLWDLEGAYRTYLYVKDRKTSMVVWTETMYVDEKEMFDFVGNENFQSPHENWQLAQWLQKMLRNFLRTTHNSIHRLKITETEYAAVLALSLWDHRLHECRPEFAAVAEKQRSLIYQELYVYYRYIMKMENYVERVANLKEVLLDLQINSFRISDDHHLLKLYTYFNEDNFMLSRLFQPAIL